MKVNILTDKEILQREIEEILKDNKIKYKEVSVNNKEYNKEYIGVFISVYTYEETKKTINLLMNKIDMEDLSFKKQHENPYFDVEEEYWIGFSSDFIPIIH